LSEAFIDNTPAENSGVGPKLTFRDRDRSKEIQPQAFSMFSPSKVATFDQIKTVKNIPIEKLAKIQRKYEKGREKRAHTVLSTYSVTLGEVMKTLPMNRLSPPFRHSGG
jgi:hypothetical protein